MGLNDAEIVLKGNEFRKCSILERDTEERAYGPGEMAVNMSCSRSEQD